MNNLKVYYGRGEYAITSLNIEKFLKHVAEYNEKNVWKTALCDYLGFDMKKGRLKRFEEIAKALEAESDETGKKLLAAMMTLELKPTESLLIRKKMTPEQRQAKVDAIKAALEESGIDADDMTKMLKAL